MIKSIKCSCGADFTEEVRKHNEMLRLAERSGGVFTPDEPLPWHKHLMVYPSHNLSVEFEGN